MHNHVHKFVLFASRSFLFPLFKSVVFQGLLGRFGFSSERFCLLGQCYCSMTAPIWNPNLVINVCCLCLVPDPHRPAAGGWLTAPGFLLQWSDVVGPH